MALRRYLLAAEFLRDLSQRGIALWPEGEKLRFRAPSGALTSSQRTLMADLKSELLEVLRDRPETTGSCVIRSFIANAFQEKCYVCSSEGEAVIVDPGFPSEADWQPVLDYIESNRLTIVRVLVTHAHVDHFYGCAFLARQIGKSFEIHGDDVDLLETAEIQAKMIGSTVEPLPPPGGILMDAQTISFGKVRWNVIHSPGHSPGSSCFYDEENGTLIAGDVLFHGAVGYITMPGGSLAQLLDSVHKKILPLPAETIVYPGHGPLTTIGVEQTTNNWVPKICEERKG